MKVVHIISGDLNKGAARGALWLHYALLEKGIDSKVLTNGDTSGYDNSIVSLSSSSTANIYFLLLKVIDLLPAFILNKFKLTLFSSGFFGFDISKHPDVKSCDIIHLHWVNLGLISYRVLSKLGKPIVWTVRDMWPITGGCHYSMSCNRYLVGCGICPQLNSKRVNDFSSFSASKKKKYYREATIYPVGIGSWISSEINSSHMFETESVTIFNNIDTSKFNILNKSEAKNELNLSSKFTILVGAQNPNDIYKGMSLLKEALMQIEEPNIQLVTFGKNMNSDFVCSVNCDVIQFGFISDDVTLNKLYCAADLFVAPSMMETFGKTLAEASCSGTPVIAFKSTGPLDIVLDEKTGYLVEPYSSVKLAESIMNVYKKSELERKQMGLYGREYVFNNFDAKITAKKYIELYSKIRG